MMWKEGEYRGVWIPVLLNTMALFYPLSLVVLRILIHRYS